MDDDTTEWETVRSSILDYSAGCYENLTGCEAVHGSIFAPSSGNSRCSYSGYLNEGKIKRCGDSIADVSDIEDALDASSTRWSSHIEDVPIKNVQQKGVLHPDLSERQNIFEVTACRRLKIKEILARLNSFCAKSKISSSSHVLKRIFPSSFRRPLQNSSKLTVKSENVFRITEYELPFRSTSRSRIDTSPQLLDQQKEASYEHEVLKNNDPELGGILSKFSDNIKNFSNNYNENEEGRQPDFYGSREMENLTKYPNISSDSPLLVDPNKSSQNKASSDFFPNNWDQNSRFTKENCILAHRRDNSCFSYHGKHFQIKKHEQITPYSEENFLSEDIAKPTIKIESKAKLCSPIHKPGGSEIIKTSNISHDPFFRSGKNRYSVQQADSLFYTRKSFPVEEDIRPPEKARIKNQSNHNPLSVTSFLDKWRLMYSPSEFEKLQRGESIRNDRNQYTDDRRYVIAKEQNSAICHGGRSRPTSFAPTGYSSRLICHADKNNIACNGLNSDTEPCSFILLLTCFILSPILLPIYTLGGFDRLISFLTHGKSLRCSQKYKRWALWACLPSWVIIVAAILIGVWVVRRK
ncbi:Bgt-198 [Blumeria graminis f. sp. tritici]|uniref:Bgt-198 n=3 Tax=Blumeria graminis TaxID=34373 RepID=A0A9X9MFB1_BLUGR|nr:Bgt-198 [Blumeria graminis f. sp. tritici]